MKTPGKLIPLFACLLLICSFAHSGISREAQFSLLKYYNNASLVEDSLKLVSSSSGLAASTVINYGFWYGICRATGLVTALSGQFGLSGTEQNELQEVKSSFCNQLAAVITSTEVALAGRVSPWPLEMPWWQPLRFVGTAYSGYAAYNNRNPSLSPLPITTASYFTHEVVARTAAGATAIAVLRYDQDQGNSAVQPSNNARNEYSMLSSIAGMMAGTIIYDKMTARGVSRPKAIFAYLITHALVEGITAISPLSTHHPDHVDNVSTKTGAEALAETGALAGSWAATSAGAITIARTSNIFSSTGILIAAAYLTTPRTAHTGTAVGMVTGLMLGTQVLILLDKQRSMLDSNHLLKNVALTLAPALALALVNGFSNNAVYGYSIEESFYETARTQWQKFYAPLDYLYTVFN